MRDKSVKTFPIPRLEYLFLPPGMPLVGKTREARETTSILVRGGAGTGKTTLAVALAHAIAREQNGVSLYLTTEFVPTELTYKAKLLGLPESLITARQPSATALHPGTVLAEHLLRTEAGANVHNNT